MSLDDFVEEASERIVRVIKKHISEGRYNLAETLLEEARSFAKLFSGDVPPSIEELRKEIYTLYVSRSLSGLEKYLSRYNDNDASSLNHAVRRLHEIEELAEKGNVPLPEDFEGLKQKVYTSFIDFYYNAANSALKDRAYKRSIYYLEKIEDAIQEGNVQPPEDFEKLKKQAHTLAFNDTLHRVLQKSIKDPSSQNNISINDLSELSFYARLSGEKLPPYFEDLIRDAYRRLSSTIISQIENPVRNPTLYFDPEKNINMALAEVYSAIAEVDPSKKENIK